MPNYTIEDFSKYKQYLNTINVVLERYFEDQKEYLRCKAGCSHCCEHGDYPFSELEFQYMLLGFFRIDPQEQKEVIKRIQALKEEYAKLEDKKEFSHRCPFLSEKGICTIYEYRGLICRTFGLITKHESGKYTIPFCQELGLNYAEVYDSENKVLDYDKVKELGYKNLPNAYRTNLKALTSEELFECEPLDFGQIHPMMHWL